jgi:uncharacterized protein
MSLTLPKIVPAFLKDRPEEKFTTREIAQAIFSLYPDECRAKQLRSSNLLTDADVIAQIAAEVSALGPDLQRRDSQIKATEGRPRKYYFTQLTDQAEVEQVEAPEFIAPATVPATVNTNGSVPQFNEQSLYPKLSEYLLRELGVFSKRIDERRARNRQGPGGNKWLFPDLVGMENLSADWHQEVIDCVKQYADRKTKLWSFEVKLLVNRSNIREVFFQTVSNSSWANLGYLVVAEVEGRDTLTELRMLASLHGIGVIKLDKENPIESEILIPARERTEIDWNTANRLVEENPDFRDYIKLVRQFYQTNDHRPRDWDYVLPSR